MRNGGVRSGCLALAGIVVGFASAGQAQPAPGVLARVEVRGTLGALGVPVFADLVGADRREYALVIAPETELAAHGLAAQVLDRNADGARYLLALERRPGARAAAAARMPVLLDDGRQIVVRSAPGRDDELASLGFDLALIGAHPLVLRAPKPSVPQIAYDQGVADMMASITQTAVWDEDGNVSGENSVTIGGTPYTISTRNTGSGTPIQKATQYAYERLAALGLTVSYQQWNFSTNPNVIGEKLGVVSPGEIVLVTAHIDDMPSSGRAPGADDNGSGSVGVLLAAQAMASRTFGRTVRFVLFTGEEQGLLGSAAYAAMIHAQGDNVVAVYNMDMIAYDGVDGPTLRLHTRTTGNPGYPADLAIAQLFSDVLTTYGMTGLLTPIVTPDAICASDHCEFWNQGYPAILAIEDDSDDFNPYYHSSNDLRSHCNMTYFTNYLKASVGVAAHLAMPAAPMVATGLDVDLTAATGSSSNLNGILEPGESVVLTPYWLCGAACDGATWTTGQLAGFTGPAGLTYSIPDNFAAYGRPAQGTTADCNSTWHNCYLVQVSAGPRPATHIDTTVTETLNLGSTKTWKLHIGNSFPDVPTTQWAYRYVENLLHSEITAGCGNGNYCPGDSVTRWQMAVFLAKAKAGANVPVSGTVPAMGDYDCVAGGQSVFGDVAPEDAGCKYIHYIAAQGITAGCGGGNYCPSQKVTRWQMGVFMAIATAPGPIPVSGTVPGMGDYDCVSGGASVFGDVPPDDGGCKFIHYIAARGITAGCGGGNYCPWQDNSRDQMAVFMTLAFGLHLYGP
jgi:hypothetical protein